MTSLTKEIKNWARLWHAHVYVTDKEIIIAGVPDEARHFNCLSVTDEDKIIARFPRPIDVETPEEICRKTHMQNCGSCNRWECGDCLHPEKKEG